MNRPAHVAILTVTTNAAGHLPAYLDALDALTYPDWSLWVVDNASADGSAELVRARRPDSHVIENEHNEGFTGACNRALLQLRDMEGVDFVLFLNDDTEVTPGFLEPLLALADRHTMVAPKTYLAAGRESWMTRWASSTGGAAPGGSACWGARRGPRTATRTL